MLSRHARPRPGRAAPPGRRRSPFSWSLTLAGMLLWLLGGQSAWAAGGKAAVDEVVVTNSSDQVLLYLTVKNGFTAEMEQGIQNGIPVTFTFFVELYRQRTGWLDQTVVKTSFDHTLTYDTLKEEYRVTCQEQPKKVSTTKSLAEARELMAQVNGFAVTPLATLLPDQDYLLRVKVRLAEKTLPLYFHYLIPFWRPWEFETDWYDVRFRY